MGWICLGLSYLSGCHAPPADPSSHPPALRGTYALTIDEDTLLRHATVQLLRGQDSVAWGQLAFEPPLNMPWSLRVTQENSDSISLNFYQRFTVALSRDGDTLRGIHLDEGQRNPVQLLRLSDTVSSALEQLNQTEVMSVRGQSGKLLPRVRWSYPTAEGIYLANIADRQIQLATRVGDHWEAKPLPGVQVDYEFTGFSLSSDRTFMVAHGSARDSTAPSYGGSDLYYLTLSAAGDSITGVTLLPKPISGPSYDLFPSLRGDSVLLFCGWGRPDGLGRGDLYQANLQGPPFSMQPYAEGVLNTPQVEAGLYEDPQGRFAIYHRNTREPFSPDNLMLTTKTEIGWSNPVPMDLPVNSEGFEFCPRLGPNGKYLYWHSDRRAYEEIHRYPLAEIPQLADFF